MPRKGLFSCSGTAIQSVSARMNSSQSLALIGPPKIAAPSCSASVSGNWSPRQGLRMASAKPFSISKWPTRPGVEDSEWRMIRILRGDMIREGGTAPGLSSRAYLARFCRAHGAPDDRRGHAAGGAAQRIGGKLVHGAGHHHSLAGLEAGPA